MSTESELAKYELAARIARLENALDEALRRIKILEAHVFPTNNFVEVKRPAKRKRGKK